MPKIIAIGGGNIGDFNSDSPEMKSITDEMVRLSGKEKPTLLFMAHTYPGYPKYQKSLYDTFKYRLGDKFNVTFLSTNELNNDLWGESMALSKLEEADIIYEIGGNTFSMLNFWRASNFDQMLKYAYKQGKIMSGFSAGANCWFNGCSSDYLQLHPNEYEPLMPLDCLGFHEGFFIPHCNQADRYCSARTFLMGNDQVGLFLSDGAALEIVDDKYRILTSDFKNYGLDPYALKGYWKDGKYFVEELDLQPEFKPSADLLSKNYFEDRNDDFSRVLKKHYQNK